VCILNTWFFSKMCALNQDAHFEKCAVMQELTSQYTLGTDDPKFIYVSLYTTVCCVLPHILLSLLLPFMVQVLYFIFSTSETIFGNYRPSNAPNFIIHIIELNALVVLGNQKKVVIVAVFNKIKITPLFSLD
jgi:hypothetical protein